MRWSWSERAAREALANGRDQGPTGSAIKAPAAPRRMSSSRPPNPPAGRTALGSVMHRTVLMLGRSDADASVWSAMLWAVPPRPRPPIREEIVRIVSLPCSGTLATPSIALHPMLYHSRQYIPVIKSIGYKWNHGADLDRRPPYRHLLLNGWEVAYKNGLVHAS